MPCLFTKRVLLSYLWRSIRHRCWLPESCTKCDLPLIACYHCDCLGEDTFPTKCLGCTKKARKTKTSISCEDCTDVLLCHAKLYILGDEWLVAELKQLAVKRMQSALKALVLNPSRKEIIMELAKFVFTNTRHNDDMRNVIALYFSGVVEDLVECEGMEELVEEAPSFGTALIKDMVKRRASSAKNKCLKSVEPKAKKCRATRHMDDLFEYE